MNVNQIDTFVYSLLKVSHVLLQLAGKQEMLLPALPRSSKWNVEFSGASAVGGQVQSSRHRRARAGICLYSVCGVCNEICKKIYA